LTVCGIFGLVDVGHDDTRAALETIRSRGPDGLYLQELELGVTFGHARLAVIDLACGTQPMSAGNGRYTISYNGEIYNFAALRGELERLGRKFATQSDTEVILEGYAQWGEAVLERLDGMFAFAIWDRDEKALFCARDRIGIKPFFYAHGTAAKGGFVFASTLAPFMAFKWMQHRLNFEAVRDYLAFQTPFAPHSFLTSVAQLPPAHCLTWSRNGKVKLRRYWSIPRAGISAPDAAALIEASDQAIAESVRRQLVADVPIGVFLSGGIDSSLIVHYMAKGGARPIRTYSVRFPEAELDETSAAQDVANAFGTEHTVFDAEDISGEAWLKHVTALDQPLADPAYIPLASLSRLTRSSVTVALSGDGGDELFGGYARFLDTEAKYPASAWQPILAALIRAGLAPTGLTRRTLSGRAMVDYRKVELGNYPGTRKDVATYLAPDALAQASPDRTLEAWHKLIDEFGGVTDTDALMRADLWTYLSENCLVKTDRASMAFGLETRVPLLGNPVTDLILRYPSSVHFDPQPKAILRALAQRYLPRSVWGRPKHGFSVPLQRYFNGAWQDVAGDLVSRTRDIAPWLRGEAVDALWSASRRKQGSRRLMYTFLVLLAWLDRNRSHVTA
jgi:asparagine synthase (glutamine-hydrolysing)